MKFLIISGAETTAKLTKLRVIVVGLRGVGVETAKNLALQGVGAITLVDSAPLTPQDLGVNFFILESDIGSVCFPGVAFIQYRCRQLMNVYVVFLSLTEQDSC
jgi:ubiquitin-activating enzyme E1